MKKGVTCGLTKERPSFETNCDDFAKDPKFMEGGNDDHLDLSAGELKGKIPPDEYKRLLEEQDWGRAVMLGSLVALLGALVWAFIAITTGYIFSILAVLLGLSISLTIRYAGKGIELKFKILSIALTFVSVLAGGFFAVIGFTAMHYEVGVIEVLVNIPTENLVFAYLQTFNFVQILIYAVAVIESVVLSLRKISPKDIAEMNAKVFKKSN
jgi:hypothetical protein